MRKKEGDASPKDIVQRIMTSAAATKKHMSRFITSFFILFYLLTLPYIKRNALNRNAVLANLYWLDCFGFRFIMRILPVELSCYASEEEISKTIVPLVTKYFPAETQDPQKVGLLYTYLPIAIEIQGSSFAVKNRE